MSSCISLPSTPLVREVQVHNGPGHGLPYTVSFDIPVAWLDDLLDVGLPGPTRVHWLSPLVSCSQPARCITSRFPPSGSDSVCYPANRAGKIAVCPYPSCEARVWVAFIGVLVANARTHSGDQSPMIRRFRAGRCLMHLAPRTRNMDPACSIVFLGMSRPPGRDKAVQPCGQSFRPWNTCGGQC